MKIFACQVWTSSHAFNINQSLISPYTRSNTALSSKYIIWGQFYWYAYCYVIYVSHVHNDNPLITIISVRKHD
jgi:hypothetical protein